MLSASVKRIILLSPFHVPHPHSLTFALVLVVTYHLHARRSFRPLLGKLPGPSRLRRRRRSSSVKEKPGQGSNKERRASQESLFSSLKTGDHNTRPFFPSSELDTSLEGKPNIYRGESSRCQMQVQLKSLAAIEESCGMDENCAHLMQTRPISCWDNSLLLWR